MASDICVALGERIRELRKKRGWRQIDLAEETGIHENYVSDLRDGKERGLSPNITDVGPGFWNNGRRTAAGDRLTRESSASGGERARWKIGTLTL